MLCGQQEGHYILQLLQLQKGKASSSGFRFLSSFRDPAGRWLRHVIDDVVSKF
jgi:hypothetical protein